MVPLAKTMSKLTPRTSLYSQTIPQENNLAFTNRGREFKAAKEPGLCTANKPGQVFASFPSGWVSEQLAEADAAPAEAARGCIREGWKDP